jgi:exonuclease VII small subunit
MSETVQSAMFEVLKSVQSSIARLEQTVTRIDQRGIEHDRRLTELERGQEGLERGQTELKELARKQRRDVAGIIVMMKSVAGDFDERVSAVERRLDAVEERLPA